MVGSVAAALNDGPSEFDARVRLLLRQADSASAEDIDRLRGIRKVTVTTGLENELLVDGEVPSRSDDGMNRQDAVYVCRFGAYTPVVERVKASQMNDLKRGMTYSLTVGDTVLLILPDDPIRASFETVKQRSDWWESRGTPGMDQAIAEGLHDRSVALGSLRGNPRFSEAVGVIQANHQTTDSLSKREHIESFLIRWLAQFDDGEAEMVLQVIAAHRRIASSDVETFIDRVGGMRPNEIPFAAKRTADMGGVQRLFTLTARGQEIFRGLDLDGAVQRIIDGPAGVDTLIVLTENILSGNQLCRALEQHYFCERPPKPAFVNRNQLHDLPGEPGDFLEQCRTFNQVVVRSAAYTEGGAEKVRELLCAKLGIDRGSVTVDGVRLDDSDCFFGLTSRISHDAKSAVGYPFNRSCRATPCARGGRLAAAPGSEGVLVLLAAWAGHCGAYVQR